MMDPPMCSSMFWCQKYLNTCIEDDFGANCEVPSKYGIGIYSLNQIFVCSIQVFRCLIGKIINIEAPFTAALPERNFSFQFHIFLMVMVQCCQRYLSLGCFWNIVHIHSFLHACSHEPFPKNLLSGKGKDILSDCMWLLKYYNCLQMQSGRINK